MSHGIPPNIFTPDSESKLLLLFLNSVAYYLRWPGRPATRKVEVEVVSHTTSVKHLRR